MKFACGTKIEHGAECTGTDHFGAPCRGKALKGKAGQPDFVFQNDAHGAVQPSLDLTKFKAVAKAEEMAGGDDTTQPQTTAQ